MDNLDRFCKGYLIEGTQKTPISLQMSLTSDIEKNPPRNIFKKMSIKDNDKDYNIPDAVEGFNVIGFEDQFARGWSHHGYYYIGNNVVFIPFSFLGISNDNKYEGKDFDLASKKMLQSANVKVRQFKTEPIELN